MKAARGLLRHIARRVLPVEVRRQLLRVRAGWLGGNRREPGPARRPPRSASAIAQSLEDRLWLGYDEAAEQLEHIAEDPAMNDADRAAAGLALGRWLMARGEYGDALTRLQMAHVALPVVSVELVSLEADCLSLLRRSSDALRLLSTLAPDPSRAMRIGAARAAVLPEEAHGSGPVVEVLNLLYGAAGYSQVYRRDVSRPIGIQNLTTAPPQCDRHVSAGRVTIIVPAYNAEHTIDTALVGLREQTWSDLEIIVVDDCSTDGTIDVVERVAASDQRVRLVRNPINRGAYAARNVGLDAATGDFVTIHDADDWSHPQKIEVQASRLAASPSLLATGTFCIRTSSDLLPTVFDGRPDHRLIGQNTSSLMFRREVFEQVGSWDEVRAAADGEFRQRVQARYGTAAIQWIDPDVPLSITLATATSLTSSGPTSFLSRFHALGARRLYRDAYQWWHASEGFLADLPLEPGRPSRPFPVPSVLETSVGSSVEVQLDVVFAGDLGVSDDFAGAVLSDLTHLDLRRVGLLNVPSFGYGTHRAGPGFRASASAGATMVGKDAGVECDLLIIGPTVAASPRLVGLPDISARRAVIVTEGDSRLEPDDLSALMAAVGATADQVEHHCMSGCDGGAPWR